MNAQHPEQPFDINRGAGEIRAKNEEAERARAAEAQAAREEAAQEVERRVQEKIEVEALCQKFYRWATENEIPPTGRERYFYEPGPIGRLLGRKAAEPRGFWRLVDKSFDVSDYDAKVSSYVTIRVTVWDDGRITGDTGKLTPEVMARAIAEEVAKHDTPWPEG